MNQDQRAAFEAWFRQKYDSELYCQARLEAWQAALESPEVQALRKDIAEYVHIAAEQATEIQELLSLLKESRQQLPMAAQFWNEDDDRARASVFVDRVMGLIAKIDAAM